MKPISTFGQTSLRNAQLRRLEGDLAIANQELASGKKNDIGKSAGAGLINLQMLRNQFSENDSYLRSINLFEQRYELMDGAFGETEKAVQELVKVASINGADALDSASTVPLLAESAIERMITALNVSIGGRYLFGGDNVDRPPLQALDVPNTNGFTPDQIIEAAIAGTGPAAPLNSGVDQTAPATAADSLDLLARMESIFQGANALGGPPIEDFSFENTLFNGELGGMLAEVRLPENQYEGLGNAQFVQGLRDVLQGAFILKNVDLTEVADDAAYQTLMTGDAANDGALDLITRGLDAILQTRVNFGLTWKVVNESQLATEAQNALLNNEIVSMEQVDRAEVTTRLLDLETQLQASYSATGRVMRLNIWNYVR